MPFLTAMFVLALLFTVIVLPIIVVMHFVTKWKSTKGLSAEEQRMLEDLWEDSEKMIARLEALETIIDEREHDRPRAG